VRVSLSAFGREGLGANATQRVAEAPLRRDDRMTAGSTPAEIAGNYADTTRHAPLSVM
jgi:hypothetical protein